MCTPRNYVYLSLTILLGIELKVQSESVRAITQAVTYLSKFGYLPTSCRSSTIYGFINCNTLIKGIKDFQRFAGLKTTGELDAETMQLISLPRCGVPDKTDFGNHNRFKRYGPLNNRWQRNDLTYKISVYPKHLKKANVDAEIFRAFSLWSKYTDLTFTRNCSGPVDIEIKFVKGKHGDNFPLDNIGGEVLAHAFYPDSGGDIHFDADEKWSIGSYRGINLFQVAVHEIGHSLGLGHSDVSSAVMAPPYDGFDPAFKLHSDDIFAIQALYGKRSLTPTVNLLCKNSKIDASFNSPDGKTYVFQGKKYYKLTQNLVADGYPKLISEGWPGLPGDIDAAFTYENGRTYFFKGTKYWRYSFHKMDGDYPKKIYKDFKGVPNHLDAAFVWNHNHKIYFFKGSKFYRYDLSKIPPIPSYSKPIYLWKGLPNNLDAVLQYYDGYTYFFKDDKYYRFSDIILSVQSANPPYPRPSANWWFGCNNTSLTKGNINRR